MTRKALLALAVCLLAGAAAGVELRRTDAYVLAADQTASRELWIVTRTADLRGTVEDDLFVAGESTTLGGEFQNDVWAAGQTVTFTGTVAEHLRVLASTAEFGGEVGKSLVAAASSVRLAAGAVVDGDAVLLGENVLCEGSIRGDLRLLAYSTTISGKVGGDVRLVADDIVVMPGTEIAGDLVYTSSKELFLDQKVMLKGRLIRKEVAASIQPPPAPRLTDLIMPHAFFYICALLAALPFLAIFPQFTGRAVRLVRQSGWKCLLVGFAAFCLMPMVGLFAVFTIIGIPLSALVLASYLIMVYLSKVIVALALAGVLLRRRGPQSFGRVFTALSLGLVLLYALAALPMAGFLVWFVIVLLGLGGMVLALFAPPDLPPAAPTGPPPLQQEPPKPDNPVNPMAPKP